MSITTTYQTWKQKFQENSSMWGSLLLWFFGVTVLLVIMASFAYG